MPSNEGTAVMIEDIVTPEQRTTLRLPIVLPLSIWRELYLSDVLKPSNLDSNTRSFLNPKISEAIASIAERNVHNGFDAVVMVRILKVEMMSKEEVDRIASRMAEMKGAGDSLQSPL